MHQLSFPPVVNRSLCSLSVGAEVRVLSATLCSCRPPRHGDQKFPFPKFHFRCTFSCTCTQFKTWIPGKTRSVTLGMAPPVLMFHNPTVRVLAVKVKLVPFSARGKNCLPTLTRTQRRETFLMRTVLMRWRTTASWWMEMYVPCWVSFLQFFVLFCSTDEV